MTVFKTFWKVIIKYKGTILLYTILTDEDTDEENLLGGVRYEFTEQNNFD